MSTGLQQWWIERTRRERVLLTVLAGLLAAMALWYGAIRPARHLAVHVRESREAAARDLADVIRLASRITSGPLRRVDRTPVDQILRNEAELAGITLASLQPEQVGATAVIDAVRSQPFFAWVANLRHGRGLVVTRLTARPNPDSTLSISVHFRRAG